MTASLQRQTGLTLISTILLLGLIAFFTLLILKIAPIYIDHSKVVNSLAGLKQTVDIQTKSKNEVWDALDKRFNLNYVYNVTKDDVKITKQGNYLKVEIDYEVVEKIVGNLSVLVEFNEVIEVGVE
ncbi:DUF4845 domain-containing protein [Methylotuvimicrobium buryatense]|uniref:DUF4845 domain-containing protein n=1 Tax=Methylotuvimicrobium buryatense TaxID=95641 RepID=A0A4P9UJJ9_METBY|nr:DUF4845 domain-containing protein [Methylotuvimicrobium buryatense]QCW81304.1 DUF4845 domain-containing protein [Methylotuvimicrobium buryatense]